MWRRRLSGGRHTKQELWRLVKPDTPALRNWPHGEQDGDDKDDSDAASAKQEAPPPYGSIDGAAVLDKVEAWYRRFIRVTFDYDYHLLALWTAHTHLAEECHTTPRLQLDSLVEGAGKTTVLDHLRRLCHDPVLIASLSSPALLPRMLNNGMRTILLDEVHRTLNSDKPGVGDLVAIINTGYRRGATRPVNVPVKGGGWEVVEMPTFAPYFVPDMHGPADPGILDEPRGTVGGGHHNVRSKPPDLKPSLRVHLAKPVEGSGGQQVHDRAVNERSLGQLEVGHGVAVVEAVQVRPVLLSPGCPWVRVRGLDGGRSPQNVPGVAATTRKSTSTPA
jgi:hypothetical protein